MESVTADRILFLSFIIRGEERLLRTPGHRQEDVTDAPGLAAACISEDF